MQKAGIMKSIMVIMILQIMTTIGAGGWGRRKTYINLGMYIITIITVENPQRTPQITILLGGGAASRAVGRQGRVSHTPDQHPPPAPAATPTPSPTTTTTTTIFSLFLFFFPYPSSLNRSVYV